MFKPTIEHLEELMRAKEICMSIMDEVGKDYFVTGIRLQIAADYIEDVLKEISEALE